MRNFCLSFFTLLTMLPLLSVAQPVERQSRAEYIEKYKYMAVEEMLISGVPASITLAQGILESGDGNSELSRKARNHFGIKCHGEWEGEKYWMDDDRRNECFRVYASVFESFRDHSEFLSSRQRYAELFTYEKTDYKKWAHGLKKAGYATNPKYPQLLIRIIEENELHQFDLLTQVPEKHQTAEQTEPNKKEKPAGKLSDAEQFKVQLGRQVQHHANRIKYIKGKENDSFIKIDEEFGVRPWQLKRYNDIESEKELQECEIVYLQPKRRRAQVDYHYVKAGETIWDISQQYGIKIKHIYKKNHMEEGEKIAEGQKLWLRKKKPRD